PGESSASKRGKAQRESRIERSRHATDKRTKHSATDREMNRSTSTGNLPLTVVGVLFFCAITTIPCQGQSPAAGKGTKQRIANPLNDLLDEVRKDIDAQKYEAAIAPLQKFLAEKDDFAYAHFQLGYVYTALGRGKEARPEYERALQLDPKMS